MHVSPEARQEKGSLSLVLLARSREGLRDAQSETALSGMP